MTLRTLRILTWVAVAAFPVLFPLSTRAADAPSATQPEPPSEAPTTAVRLFAAVEEAWARSDVEGIASLADSTSVRIALKPGAPLTSARTRVAAAFLLQDQLRLVHTSGFQVKRFDCDKKGRFCKATASWTGDWGGRQGNRSVRVTLTAKPWTDRWVLTEIRAD